MAQARRGLRHDDAALLTAAGLGDRRARDQLVVRHLHLVRAIASLYRDMGLPLDDLTQEGAIGLLEAIDRYDPSRGTFDVYARFRIRRAVRNALTEQSRVIRLPKHVIEERRAIERAEARWAARRGRSPTTAELATAVGLPRQAVLRARSANRVPLSLDESVAPDGSPLESVVADPALQDPAVEAVEHEQSRLLDDALAELPPRQREIVTRHFGLGRDAEDVADVADSLHLSAQRTRTIERDALYTLRDRLDDYEVPRAGEDLAAVI